MGCGCIVLHSTDNHIQSVRTYAKQTIIIEQNTQHRVQIIGYNLLYYRACHVEDIHVITCYMSLSLVLYV